MTHEKPSAPCPPTTAVWEAVQERPGGEVVVAGLGGGYQYPGCGLLRSELQHGRDILNSLDRG